jgi:hypothetical protein
MDVKKIHRIPDGGGMAGLRAVGFFAAHGISRMERLMTDNASVCRLSLYGPCVSYPRRWGTCYQTSLLAT